jgi:S1-C subfamily serine protease
MTATVVDVILLIIIGTNAASGWRQGAATAALSLMGMLAGLSAAWWILPPLVDRAAWAESQPAVRSVVLVLALGGSAILGQVLGDALGRYLSPRPDGRRGALSALGGALVMGGAATLMSWVVASMLAMGTSSLLREAVTSSRVLAGFEAMLPEAGVDRARIALGGLVDRGLPRIIENLGGNREVAAPDPALARRSGIRSAAASIVEVSGATPSCGRGAVGSGWVFGPERVVTNAHVVAGMTAPTVRVQGRGSELAARVVIFDPVRDLAVLKVPGLTADSLSLGSALSGGDAAVIAGFPGGGRYTVTPVRVRQVITTPQEDIYGAATSTQREIYSLRASIRQGNSGGPLVNADGEAVGIVFASSLSYADTGYALTLAEMTPVLQRGRSATAAVSTGRCA